MKAPFSTYLDQLTPLCKELVERLDPLYDYVSLLATDSVGLSLRIAQRRKSVSNSNMTTERGIVVRAAKNGLYSEYAFDCPGDRSAEALAEEIRKTLDAQLALLAKTGTKPYETGALEDEPLELFVEKEAEELPEEADLSRLVDFFTELSNKGMETVEGALDVILSGNSTHISKLFLTKHRFLRQSYVYTAGNSITYAPNAEGELKTVYRGASGCGGVEIL